MEKIGVEVEKTLEQKKLLEKKASLKEQKPVCSHPATHVYKSKGTEYCRKCEKYLKI